MNKALALALVIVFLTASILAVVQPIHGESPAPELQWSKTYPRSPSTLLGFNATHYDGGSCFVQTIDGGYAIVGNTEDHVYYSQHGGFSSSYSAIMIKTDPSGNLQWQKINPDFYNTLAIFQTQDSGYFMVVHGWTLLWLDYQANILSNKTLSMPISGVQQTSDGDYIFVSANGNNAIIAKTDQNGDLLWNKTLYAFPNSFTNSIFLSNIALANDGNFLVAGWSQGYSRGIGDGNPNLWLLKVDSNGNLLFDRAFSYNANVGVDDQNPAAIGAVFVTATKDDGCLLTGTAGLNGFPFLVKLASNGDWRWNHSYACGVTVRAILTSAIETPNGKFVAVGGFPFTGFEKALILEFDANGDLEWKQTFNSTVGFDTANSIKVTSDGEYAVIGAQNGNVWFAKFAFPTLPTTFSPNSIVTSVELTLIIVIIALAFIAVTVVSILLYRKHRKPVALS
jgi:hypothetical protein